MRILVSLFLGVLSVGILAGCGARYRIGNETFSSSSEALKRQTEILGRPLDTIKPTANPVHGTVLVLFPSDVEIQKNYIRFGNNPSKIGRDGIDFLIASSKNGFQFIVDMIQKREIFDSVSVERHNGNPASFPIGDYDFLIFRDVDGWFIKGKNNPRPLPLRVDKSTSDAAPSPLVFLDLLCQQAEALHSK